MAVTVAEAINHVVSAPLLFMRVLIDFGVGLINTFEDVARLLAGQFPSRPCEADEDPVESTMLRESMGVIFCVFAAAVLFLLEHHPQYLRHPIDALTAEGRARIRERVEEQAQRDRAEAQARIDEWNRHQRERDRRKNEETDEMIEEMREELASRDRDPHVLREYDKSTRLAFLETELLRLQEMVEHVPAKSARKRD